MTRQSTADYLAGRAEIDPQQREAVDLLDDYRVADNVSSADAIENWPGRSKALAKVRRYFPQASI